MIGLLREKPVGHMLVSNGQTAKDTEGWLLDDMETHWCNRLEIGKSCVHFHPPPNPVHTDKEWWSDACILWYVTFVKCLWLF